MRNNKIQTIVLKTCCFILITIMFICILLPHQGIDQQESINGSFWKRLNSVEKATCEGLNDTFWIVEDPATVAALLDLIRNCIIKEHHPSEQELKQSDGVGDWHIALGNVTSDFAISIDGEVYGPEYKMRIRFTDYEFGIKDTLYFYEREPIRDKIMLLMHSGSILAMQNEADDIQRFNNIGLSEAPLIEVSVNAESLSDNGLSVSIKNIDTAPILIGNNYHVEEYLNSEWSRRETSINLLYYLGKQRLKKGEEISFDIDWSNYYGSLPPGKYRLVKTVWKSGTEMLIRADFELDDKIAHY